MHMAVWFFFVVRCGRGGLKGYLKNGASISIVEQGIAGGVRSDV
jgi:hypothetical protein